MTMEIPWYDVALALILVASAIAFAAIGTWLVRRHTRKVNDLIRAEIIHSWRQEWLVGDPLFEAQTVVAVDPAGSSTVTLTKPGLSDVWQIVGVS
jgi:hypothetical protein